MKLYKLTDQDGKTYGGCQWGPGVTHETDRKGELCGRGFIHAYTDPLLAVLLNPIHGDFKNPRLWEGEGDVVKNDHGLNVGTTRFTTLREIPVPEVNTVERVAFGILCALRVYKDDSFITWAENWLTDKDRSTRAAQATRASVEAALLVRAQAAQAALEPDWMSWTLVETAAWSAAWAAEEEDQAARAAAWAVEATASVLPQFDLVAIAQEAIKVSQGV